LGFTPTKKKFRNFTENPGRKEIIQPQEEKLPYPYYDFKNC